MGLLDSLNDPKQQGLLALGLGLLNSRGNFGQALGQAGQQGMQAMLEARQRQQMEQRQRMQDEMLRVQMEREARKAALLEPLMRRLQGGESTQMPAVSAALAQGAQAGSVGPTVANAQRLPAPAQGGGIASLTPDDIAAAKLGGLPDLADVYKLTLPNWQNVNGYMVNTNDKNFKGGFMPGMQVSSNGQATLTTVGPDGMPTVSAPRGALDAYSAYRDADERAKAGYDITTVTPAGGSPQLTTRGRVVREIGGAAPAPGGREKVDLRPDDQRKAIYHAEYQKAVDAYNAAIGKKDMVAAARARADMDALDREMKAAGIPKLGIQLQSPAEAKRELVAVDAEGKVSQEKADEVKKARDTLSNIAVARSLLKMGPTASSIGTGIDKGLGFFGKSTEGANLAAKLENISAWMTSNVPRFEGPQSDSDKAFYVDMAGRVGDRTRPISQRIAALDILEQMMSAKLGGSTQSPQQDSAKPPLNELPKQAPKGSRVRDTQTGEILVFNGLQWVKESR